MSKCYVVILTTAFGLRVVVGRHAQLLAYVPVGQWVPPLYWCVSLAAAAIMHIPIIHVGPSQRKGEVCLPSVSASRAPPYGKPSRSRAAGGEPAVRVRRLVVWKPRTDGRTIRGMHGESRDALDTPEDGAGYV